MKTLDSVTEKLETGRYGRWSELDDLVAFTVVVPTSAHEQGVIEMLDNHFRRNVVRARGTVRKPPDVFRFDATRWYGCVRNEPPPPLDARASEMLFEVQTKTAFEDAWSIVTHDLVFKGQDVDWRTKRLAAQLKAQVEQIDLLVNEFSRSAEVITASRDAATDAQQHLVGVFKLLIQDGLVPESLTPVSWQRFAECMYGLARNSVRRADRAEERVRDICSTLDETVRSGTFLVPVSGSLFQAVVAHVSNTHDPEWLEGFPIVWSDELESLYKLDPPPTLLDLDS